MFSFRSPDVDKLQDLYINSTNLTYGEVGLTRDLNRPNGYWINYRIGEIGKGEEIFDKAREKINNLDNLKLPWVTIKTDRNRLEPNLKIAMSTRFLGFLVTNITKVIEIIDIDNDDFKKYGYIYGTTDKHTMKGEEIFILEFNKRKNTVFYTVFSFSKPQHILNRVMIYFIRKMQIRFSIDSLKRMKIN